MAHKCELGIISLFPSSTVKGFGELCIVYKAEMACFGSCFDCLSIQVGFTVAAVYAVVIEVSNDHLWFGGAQRVYLESISWRFVD